MRFVQEERAASLGGAGLTKSKYSTSCRGRSATALTKILPNEESVASAPFALDHNQVIFRGFASEGVVIALCSIPLTSLFSLSTTSRFCSA
jgi:hypothetical protein